VDGLGALLAEVVLQRQVAAGEDGQVAAHWLCSHNNNNDSNDQYGCYVRRKGSAGRKLTWHVAQQDAQQDGEIVHLTARHSAERRVQTWCVLCVCVCVVCVCVFVCVFV
jgi:hypothetical protein